MATFLARVGLLSLLLACSSAWCRDYTYKCVDGTWAKFSQREIPNCHGVHTMTTPGGWEVLVPPPNMTFAERRAYDECVRKLDSVGRPDPAVERASAMLLRYPDEAAHQKARLQALERPREAVGRAEVKVGILWDERERLEVETAQYVGHPLPSDLKQKLEANDALATSERQRLQKLSAEVASVDARFDAELAQLKELWRRTPPIVSCHTPKPKSA